MQTEQFPTAGAQLAPFLIQKAGAQGGQHTHAPVVGGGAAQPHQDIDAPLVQQTAQQLAGSIGGGAPGVPLLRG